jgi:hypothetical protein
LAAAIGAACGILLVDGAKLAQIPLGFTKIHICRSCASRNNRPCLPFDSDVCMRRAAKVVLFGALKGAHSDAAVVDSKLAPAVAAVSFR